jgi:ABC-type amino acid transport substrate-binding protein
MKRGFGLKSLAVGAVVALTLTACSSSSDDTAADETAEVTAEETMEEVEAEESEAEVAVDLGLSDPNVLNVGMTLQFKPQMYRDDAGEPAGYDVALLELLAEDMGVELEIQDLDFTGLIPGLQAGQFDMVSVGLSNTPERAESIDFTREYVPYAQILVAGAGSNPSTNLEDWNSADFKISALQGSTAAKLIGEQFPNATLVEMPDQTGAFLEVATGRANAIVVESYLFDQFNTANPDQLERVDTEPLSLQFGSYAVQKGNTALADYLNTWLCDAQGSGLLAETYETEQGGIMPQLPQTCS